MQANKMLHQLHEIKELLRQIAEQFEITIDDEKQSDARPQLFEECKEHFIECLTKERDELKAAINNSSFEQFYKLYEKRVEP